MTQNDLHKEFSFQWLAYLVFLSIQFNAIPSYIKRPAFVNNMCTYSFKPDGLDTTLPTQAVEVKVANPAGIALRKSSLVYTASSISIV